MESESIEPHCPRNRSHFQPFPKWFPVLLQLSKGKAVQHPSVRDRKNEEPKDSQEDGISLPYHFQGNRQRQNVLNSACIETVVEIVIMAEIDKIRQHKKNSHGDQIDQPYSFCKGGTK